MTHPTRSRAAPSVIIALLQSLFRYIVSVGIALMLLFLILGWYEVSFSQGIIWILWPVMSFLVFLSGLVQRLEFLFGTDALTLALVTILVSSFIYFNYSILISNISYIVLFTTILFFIILLASVIVFSITVLIIMGKTTKEKAGDVRTEFHRRIFNYRMRNEEKIAELKERLDEED